MESKRGNWFWGDFNGYIFIGKYIIFTNILLLFMVSMPGWHWKWYFLVILTTDNDEKYVSATRISPSLFTVVRISIHSSWYSIVAVALCYAQRIIDRLMFKHIGVGNKTKLYVVYIQQTLLCVKKYDISNLQIWHFKAKKNSNCLCPVYINFFNQTSFDETMLSIRSFNLTAKSVMIWHINKEMVKGIIII